MPTKKVAAKKTAKKTVKKVATKKVAKKPAKKVREAIWTVGTSTSNHDITIAIKSRIEAPKKSFFRYLKQSKAKNDPKKSSFKNQ